MRLPVHFIFNPSVALTEAASQANESRLAEASVWTTHVTDRAGLEHPQKQLQDAFWAHFRAHLVYDGETEIQREFRSRCLQLGFAGCWSVVETMGGGPAEDLVDSGREAIAFLEGRLSSTGAA